MRNAKRFSGCGSAAALIASAAISHATIIHGPVWNPSNGHLYYLLAHDSWPAAEQEAISLGGHLVAINDDAECDWIYANFSFFQDYPRAIWIGLTDEGSEGEFRWVNGDPYLRRNWLVGEPNNDDGLGGSENYVFLFPAADPSSPRWRDANDWASSPPEGDPRWVDTGDNIQGAMGLVEIAPITPPPASIEITETSGGVVVSWITLLGGRYQLQSTRQPGSNLWENFGGTRVGTRTGAISVTVPFTQTHRFFRVIGL